MKGEIKFANAKPLGNGAAVLVPKRWLGWRIKCEVVRRISKAKETPKTDLNGLRVKGDVV